MSTKGNTGQSSDSLGPLGKKESWHNANMDGPPMEWSKGTKSSKGRMGFGNDDLGILGNPKCIRTASPGSDAAGFDYNFKKVSSRGNVNGYNDIGLGKSQEPGEP